MTHIGDIVVGPGRPLTVIAGPCVIESEALVLDTAAALAEIARRLPVQFVFKSSYRKANRSAPDGFTGIGFDEGLAVLDRVRREVGAPVLTDIHNEAEAALAARAVDALQIPAFLCRQTDLLLAAGRTGLPVNIKKGQFLAPEQMALAAHKVFSTGNTQVLLTERGTVFGHGDLVVDMRGLAVMAATGLPVVYDATHSVQQPGGLGHASGGRPECILPLARAALATGAVCAVFIETHPDPPRALSDAACQLPLAEFERALEALLPVYEAVGRARGSSPDTESSQERRS